MANAKIYEKKWKYLSIGLMAVLALGFLLPQAFAAPIDSVLTIVQDIQAKVNSSVFGLQAIKNAVDTKASQTSVNAISYKALSLRTLELHQDLSAGPYPVRSGFAVQCDKPFIVHMDFKSQPLIMI